MFDDVVLDIDGSYNNNTGEFTCPAMGLYVLTLSAHFNTPPFNEADLQILLNGVFQYYGPYVKNTQTNERESGTSTLT